MKLKILFIVCTNVSTFSPLFVLILKAKTTNRQFHSLREMSDGLRWEKKRFYFDRKKERTCKNKRMKLLWL
jgi:hypothetical protein